MALFGEGFIQQVHRYLAYCSNWCLLQYAFDSSRSDDRSGTHEQPVQHRCGGDWCLKNVDQCRVRALQHSHLDNGLTAPGRSMLFRSSRSSQASLPALPPSGIEDGADVAKGESKTGGTVLYACVVVALAVRRNSNIRSMGDQRYMLLVDRHLLHSPWSRDCSQ